MYNIKDCRQSVKLGCKFRAMFKCSNVFFLNEQNVIYIKCQIIQNLFETLLTELRESDSNI